MIEDKIKALILPEDNNPEGPYTHGYNVGKNTGLALAINIIRQYDVDGRLEQGTDELIRLKNLFIKVENISNLNSEDADGDHESLLDNINSIANEAIYGVTNRNLPKDE